MRTVFMQRFALVAEIKENTLSSTQLYISKQDKIRHLFIQY